jgi:hypothetical protein
MQSKCSKNNTKIIQSRNSNPTLAVTPRTLKGQEAKAIERKGKRGGKRGSKCIFIFIFIFEVKALFLFFIKVYITLI